MASTRSAWTERLSVERGRDARRPRVRGLPRQGAPAHPPPSAYTNGVVTPHAAFLALLWAPRRTLANLARLEADFDIYGEWGFRDSVNVDTGVVSSFWLSLDQGMIMAAIGNALADDVLRRAFATRATERALRPAVGVEEFAAEPRGCTVRRRFGRRPAPGNRS